METVIPERLKIGTRGSLLALAQTDLLIDAIRRAYPGVCCEKVIIKTAGDRILDRPLAAFGGKGVFVTEFEDAIRQGRIDCAVHSAKDMPLTLADGLSVVCTLPREDVRDVLIMRRGIKLAADGEAVIGTGSLRRRAQLAALYPNLTFAPLRGNVPTRLEKLRDGAFDGIVLAAAGLKRLGLDVSETFTLRYLDEEDVIPAGGQAVIAVEGRRGEGERFFERLTDVRAAMELEAERAVLKRLNAGCHAAVGVRAKVCAPEGAPVTAESAFVIRAMTESGGAIYRQECRGGAGERLALAEQTAERLMAGANQCEKSRACAKQLRNGD